MGHGMKEEDVRRLQLNNEGPSTRCRAAGVVVVTGAIIGVARRFLEESQTSHENLHS